MKEINSACHAFWQDFDSFEDCQSFYKVALDYSTSLSTSSTTTTSEVSNDDVVNVSITGIYACLSILVVIGARLFWPRIKEVTQWLQAGFSMTMAWFSDHNCLTSSTTSQATPTRDYIWTDPQDYPDIVFDEPHYFEPEQMTPTSGYPPYFTQGGEPNAPERQQRRLSYSVPSFTDSSASVEVNVNPTSFMQEGGFESFEYEAAPPTPPPPPMFTVSSPPPPPPPQPSQKPNLSSISEEDDKQEEEPPITDNG
jgi:hypothetical protein